ncbi:MAG: hypothetical protein N2Z72_08830 [Bacteroidales bacterium]|nr:hypothetical protein [Bacteroidales bacterium]
MKRKVFYVSFLFVLNVITRFYGIWFEGFAWDEEQLYLGARLLGKFFYQLSDGIIYLDPQFVSIYGPVGKYLAFVGLCSYELYAYWFGYDINEALWFIRLFSSFLPSFLTVWFLYRISLRYNDERIAMVTLLFSAFAFRWVEAAHYAVPDSLTAFFVVVTIYLLLQEMLLEKKLFWLSFIIALAFHTKIHVGGLLALFSVIVMLWQMKLVNGFRFRQLLRFFLLSLFWLVIVGLPYVIYWQDFLDEILYHMNEFPFVVKGSPLSYFFFKPVMGIDIGMLLLALIGIGFSIYEFKVDRNSSFFLMVGWVLIFYAYLSFTKGAIPRWEIPMIPLLVLLAAYGIKRFVEFFPRKQSLILTLFIFICILRPAYHILMLDAGFVHRKLLSVSEWYEKYQCKKVFYNYALDYPKMKYFLRSDCNCAVLYEPYWNDLETNGIPSWLESPKNNASFIGNASDSIRSFVRKHWKKTEEYNPPFFTPWTFNPAASKKIFLYVKN